MRRITFGYKNLVFSVGIATALLSVGCRPAEEQLSEENGEPLSAEPRNAVLGAHQQQTMEEHSLEVAECAQPLTLEGQGNGQNTPTTVVNTTDVATDAAALLEAHSKHDKTMTSADSQLNAQDSTEDEAQQKASVDGKYQTLLHKIEVPSDVDDEGEFSDYGYSTTSSWKGHDNLASGFWVYVYPHWYIWAVQRPQDWSAEEGGTLEGHRERVSSVAFSPDGKTLASGSSDNTIKLWDLQSGMMTHTLTGHRNDVNVVAFSPDGSLLASASDDHTVKLWDPHTGSQGATLKAHHEGIKCIAFSPDGTMLASKDYENGIIAVWDTKTGNLRQEIDRVDWVETIVFSPDGKSMFWDDDTGGRIYSWDLRSNWFSDLTISSRSSQLIFSPDGTTLASAAGSSIKLYDAKTRRLRRMIPVSDDEIYVIAYSPDGRTLASSSGVSSMDYVQESTIKFWDSQSGKLEGKRESHVVTSLAFSADGSMLAVNGAERDRNAVSMFPVASVVAPAEATVPADSLAATDSEESESPSNPEQQARADYQVLQGSWNLVAQERDKKRHQSDSKWGMQIDGWTASMDAPGKGTTSWTYSIDSSSFPRRFDLYRRVVVQPKVEGPRRGSTRRNTRPRSDRDPLPTRLELVYQAVYELEGDKLTICLAGPGEDRPLNVSTAEGDGTRLLVLKRAQMNASASRLSKATETLDELTAHYIGSTGCIDYFQTAELIQDLAASGDPLGRLWFARCLFKGRSGFDEDTEAAQAIAQEVIGLVQQRASQNDLHAQFLCGSALEEGLGTEENKNEAARWYRIAGQKGHPIAAHNLSFIHKYAGRVDEAVLWTSRAAETGHAKAMNNMGVFYHDGDTILGESRHKAQLWFERAAAAGVPEARENLSDGENTGGNWATMPLNYVLGHGSAASGQYPSYRSGPGWDEDTRYEQYKTRQRWVEGRERLNQSVPGFQPIPQNALGIRP